MVPQSFWNSKNIANTFSVELFKKHKGLLKGKVGNYTGKPVKLKLKEGAEPFKTKRAYDIPQAIKQTVKGEVSRMDQ